MFAPYRRQTQLALVSSSPLEEGALGTTRSSRRTSLPGRDGAPFSRHRLKPKGLTLASPPTVRRDKARCRSLATPPCVPVIFVHGDHVLRLSKW